MKLSDDLVKRLRDSRYDGQLAMRESAANRIERLERELAEERYSREVAAAKGWEFSDRIKRLEAALRGVIAIADRDCPEFREARAALEEKKDD